MRSWDKKNSANTRTIISMYVCMGLCIYYFRQYGPCNKETGKRTSRQRDRQTKSKHKRTTTQKYSDTQLSYYYSFSTDISDGFKGAVGAADPPPYWLNFLSPKSRLFPWSLCAFAINEDGLISCIPPSSPFSKFFGSDTGWNVNLTRLLASIIPKR